jgi:hypothetical protein
LDFAEEDFCFTVGCLAERDDADFMIGLTFEFTGLRGFSRRSGGMMG